MLYQYEMFQHQNFTDEIILLENFPIHGSHLSALYWSAQGFKN